MRSEREPCISNAIRTQMTIFFFFSRFLLFCVGCFYFNLLLLRFNLNFRNKQKKWNYMLENISNESVFIITNEEKWKGLRKGSARTRKHIFISTLS